MDKQNETRPEKTEISAGEPAQTSPRAGGAEPQSRKTATPFPIVGIGASAGGLEAFEEFFRAMPADSGMAFVLVAHLDPTHVSLLPELLQKHTQMRVFQVEDGMVVEPNAVYVIPPNKDLNLFNGVLQLMDLTHPRGARLPIDSFFRSLAQDQGSNAVCIILSGTGSDGTLGLKAIKGELGMVMVQDETSARYDGMPRSAIVTNLADYVLPPEKMPENLVLYVQHAKRRTDSRLAAGTGPVTSALQKVYALLCTRTNHDFSMYKENTICRRIERRMHVHQLDDVAGYVRYLQESEREIDVLFKELLIGVTSFFRDPQAFETLKGILLQHLAGRPKDYNFRVWVPGCSTGEEAYSIAILLQECMEELKAYLNVQVFGTDIDDEAIDVARTALYPPSIASDVSPERLPRHFLQEDEGYRIRKTIRETLVFALQNVIRDPPFTKLDLLCCRNLLIYLDPELQQRLLPVFHYSLKPDGILFLGSSETVGSAVELFGARDKKWKIFTRKQSVSAAPPAPDFPLVSREPERPERHVAGTVQQAEELSALQLVETILQASDTPPCAIVDAGCNLLYIHGRTGRFLEPATGRTSVNVLEMARPGLKTELSAALREVAVHRKEVVRRGVRVEQDGGHLHVDLLVRPILEQTPVRGLLMIVFDEAAAPPKEAASTKRPAGTKKKGRTAEELERELQHMQENLRTTIEELETSNEELKSTNEELQSTNEELQSTNEELETSKEELQSLNEESATVNAELQNRVEELSQTHDDMKNLLDGTQIATLFLDMGYRIQRFTPKMTEIIPLTGSDIDRPITDLAIHLEDVDLMKLSEKVLDTLIPEMREVMGKDQRFFSMRILPYRTVNNVIDGVVITLEDITRRRQVEEELRVSEGRMRSILRLSGDGIYEIDLSGKIVFANEAYAKIFGYTVEEFIGRDWTEFVHFKPVAEAETLNERLRAGETIEGESVGIHRDGHEVHTWFRAGPVYRDEEVVGIIGTIGRLPSASRLTNERNRGEG